MPLTDKHVIQASWSGASITTSSDAPRTIQDRYKDALAIFKFLRGSVPGATYYEVMELLDLIHDAKLQDDAAIAQWGKVPPPLVPYNHIQAATHLLDKLIEFQDGSGTAWLVHGIGTTGADLRSHDGRGFSTFVDYGNLAALWKFVGTGKPCGVENK